MARKAKKTPEIIETQVENPVVAEATQPLANDEQPAEAQPQELVIAYKLTANNRYYIYFRGVAPENNVGCGCKSAKSALRYIHLLKKRHGATIGQSTYESLKAAAAKEA